MSCAALRQPTAPFTVQGAPTMGADPAWPAKPAWPALPPENPENPPGPPVAAFPRRPPVKTFPVPTVPASEPPNDEPPNDLPAMGMPALRPCDEAPPLSSSMYEPPSSPTSNPVRPPQAATYVAVHSQSQADFRSLMRCSPKPPESALVTRSREPTLLTARVRSRPRIATSG